MEGVYIYREETDKIVFIFNMVFLYHNIILLDNKLKYTLKMLIIYYQ